MFSFLFRIQLNDQLFLNVLGDVCALGLVEQFAGLLGLVPFNPGILAVVEASESCGDHLKILCLLANTDDLTGLNAEGGDVDNLTVDNDVTVADELASSGAAGSDTKTEHYVVETTLEVLEEDLTGNAVCAGCLLEHIAELFLEYAIGVLCLLLLSKHDTVLGGLATTVVAVLPRGEVAL